MKRIVFLISSAAAAVRSWDDPMVRFGGMAPREMMRADAGDLIYGVEQRLPSFGKAALRHHMVLAERWEKL